MRAVTLDEAIRLALEVNPAAVAARSAVDNAEAGLLQARGAWLPNLTLGSTFLNSSNQRFDQSTGRLVSKNYTAQANGSLELFDGGRRLLDQRAASASVSAAEAGLESQRFLTALETTQIFYSAAAGGDLLGAAQRRLDRANQQLEFAKTRLEVGTATRSDLLRAELEVGNAELAVVNAESDLQSAQLALGRQIGLAEPVAATAAALPDRAPALPAADRLIELATRGSPAVVAAEARWKSQRAEKLSAYTPYLPSLRLTGGYDWFGFDFPPDQRSWSLRLLLNLPVFNGFQREAAVQRAAAAERSAEATAKDALLAARTRVESAVQAIRAAEKRVGISARAVDVAREDLRVQEERYQIGAATILELQTSQVALSDAEAQAVLARQALGLAVAELENVLGRTLTEIQGES